MYSEYNSELAILIEPLSLKDKVTVNCKNCNKELKRTKKSIQQQIWEKASFIYCTVACRQLKTKILTSCKECGKSISRNISTTIKSKNLFCSQSCSGTYNNKHKTTGYRRSKLELFLEEKFKLEYPNLEVKYSDRITIGYELDFYFPTLSKAIELNGVFHYRKIYSTQKLDDIQRIDKLKKELCKTNKINLLVLPTLYKYRTTQSKENIWKLILAFLQV